MKILFLCASADPGRDGVGDYTLQLASACAREGHECTLVALHDHITSEDEGVSVSGVKVIRLSAPKPWPVRVRQVAEMVARSAPDWISWQIVGYSYNPRGLLPPAMSELAARSRGPRQHVMLHELWIGLEEGAPWRQRVLGWWQKRRLLDWLRNVRPVVLHTSNVTYQRVLAETGFTADVLPLFGNVPVIPGSARTRSSEQWLPSRPSKARDSLLVALTFGTLHPQWRPTATAVWLRAAAQAMGRKPMVLAVGRLGNHDEVLQTFKREGVAVATTGEQDLGTISVLLGEADLGIALHPWALVGKSGAAAAMLDHGLPVLVPRDDWRRRNGNSTPPGSVDPLLCRLDALPPTEAHTWLAQRRSAQPALPRVMERFLAALTTAPARG